MNKQCPECFQFYPEQEIKECIFHFRNYSERIVTKNGEIKEQVKENKFCKYCAPKHKNCGAGGWA